MLSAALKNRRIAIVALLVLLPACKSIEPVQQPNPTRLGFAVGYRSSETDVDGDAATKLSSFQATIDAGHRVMPNLELGGLFDVLNESIEDVDSGDESSLDLWTVGPQARFYLVSEGNVQPWLSIAAGLGKVDLDSDDGDATFFQGGVGVSYFPSRWVALEGSLRFQRYNLEADDGLGTTDFDTDSLNFLVGLSTFF